jgi:type IV secretory pathway VirB10-like protein
MLNKNTNDELNSNMLNLDDPESEMGGDKKKLDKKAIIFIIFVLFLLLGLIILFFTPSSKKDTAKEEIIKQQKITLPSTEIPKLSFSEQPPPPSSPADNSTNSLDLIKKRQLDLSIIEGSALKKDGSSKIDQLNDVVIKKTYGLNALNSSSFLDEESSSQYIIKRRSSNNSSKSTLMVLEEAENAKSITPPSNTVVTNSDIDFSDFIKNEKSYIDKSDNTNSTKQDSDSAKKFPESVLGESVNAVAKPEPYHATVLARKIPMNPNFFIPQGTSIRCVMETMVIADVSGPTLCIVPESIRSFNGLNVLIPKGSKIIGDYEKTSLREERVPIIWTRLITPDNIDIALNSTGTSLLGANNVPGSVDKRWGERLFTATLISLGIDAFAWKVVDKLPKKYKTTVVNGSVIREEVDFDSTTIKNLRSFTEDELKKSLDIPYRLVINQGTIGSIFVARDLDFSSVYSDSK